MRDWQQDDDIPKAQRETSFRKRLRDIFRQSEGPARPEPLGRREPPPPVRETPPVARAAAALPRRTEPRRERQNDNPPQEEAKPLGVLDGKTLGEIFADAFRKGTTQVFQCMKPLQFKSAVACAV